MRPGPIYGLVRRVERALDVLEGLRLGIETMLAHLAQFAVAACRAEPTRALAVWGWENGRQMEPQILYVMQRQSIDLWAMLADSSERCCIKRTSCGA